MRILAADAFTDKDTAINTIPVNYLSDGDLCLVKIGTEYVDYISAIYFYEYKKDDGNDQNIPFIVTPLDQFVPNVLDPELPSDDGGRWKLKDIYTNKLVAGEISTNTITAATTGAITIGDDLTITDEGIIVDGQVTIESSILEPPMVVNSDVLVENLNAQYINGEASSDFMKNQSYKIPIPNGVQTLTVTMPYEMTDPPHYSAMIDVCNLDDVSPSIYSWIITDKSATDFTVRFSGVIDSENYFLHYFLIGTMAE